MIEISNLQKKYGKTIALSNVSLHIDKGLLSLVGPNGSGKTTLIKSILKLVQPDSGTIKINGTKIEPNNYLFRNNIGYMPQIGRYPEHLTITQLFDLLIQLRNFKGSREKLDWELYEEFKIDAIKEKRMHSLSGGTRQKVSAIIAFLFNPSIIILDEPTAGLDPIATSIVKNKLSYAIKEGKTIVMTSHILSDLEEITSRIAYLQDGELLFYDSVESLLQRSQESKLSSAIAFLMKKYAHE